MIHINQKEDLIFSFLLVVRNEEDYIENLLESILHQDFPHDRYEIIIIDGESTDRTPELVEAFERRYPDRIRSYMNPRKILATGWNIGIQHSRGRYVIRVDGHSQIPRDFLSRTYEVAQRVPEAACVGGVIESRGTGFWGEVNAYVYSHPFGVGNSKFRTTKNKWEGYVDTVPYAAYKREVFEEVGYFDENLKRNEDLEMHARVRRAGGKFFLSTIIRSTYYVRNTLPTLMQKSFADGKWTLVASKRGMGVLRGRHFIPFIVVMATLAFTVASFFSAIAWYTFLTLMGTYTTLLLVSSWGLKKEKGWKYFVPTMVSFFLLHFSRGVGSAAGLMSREYWGNERVYEERYDKNVTNAAR
ncbi:glycosyltransferase family 2 protein [Desmospora activa]|uniref:Cellulose synthase/poly-beta-1,6-N-acetylglucosamine synthase-like glycosyltransferase n=1 Tax=Desmospora activa DSM 45169 TaxID=1121389 RepID=A0A2T4Z6F6_9BACL|nr:glycosyltransferase family 2 protein [Desmospora activa]PTM57472.1 cellulose synthase/poly-beta-1,6-N-acetylglucosamine synthase-like glycosyltransferase [Desmospora activa DSM 45169]